tara:strand:+ start:843 stop:1367 length:525 start_codon:yes stop_codon:yes gene_type:complete
MKFFFLTFSFLFLFLINEVKAASDIAFIDMDKLIIKSKPGSSILNQLKEINKQNIKKFDKNEKVLKENEDALIAKKNILSDIQFKKEITKLKSDIGIYNDNRNKTILAFNKIKLNNTNKLLKLINPILRSYADENSIGLILQKKNIIVGKTELDITEEVILLINKSIKEFKLND